jgi:hypothetical protein
VRQANGSFLSKWQSGRNNRDILELEKSALFRQVEKMMSVREKGLGSQ